MRIYLIIGREDSDPEAAWVVDAVDEWTVDEHLGSFPGEFQEKLDSPPEDVEHRLLMVTIPDDALRLPWAMPTVAGEVAG